MGFFYQPFLTLSMILLVQRPVERHTPVPWALVGCMCKAPTRSLQPSLGDVTPFADRTLRLELIWFATFPYPETPAQVRSEWQDFPSRYQTTTTA